MATVFVAYEVPDWKLDEITDFVRWRVAGDPDWTGMPVHVRRGHANAIEDEQGETERASRLMAEVWEQLVADA